ncbi:MAG: hypothetical protein LBT08_09300 [Synergistaceae bacterium]|jgi:hypothetical protein|nr:hypothetical protein [Synergistaceae bacterium]
MKNLSLKNIDAFKILDDDTREVSYGCSQDWFGTEWQRRSGCGPSAVSNIFLYLDYPGQSDARPNGGLSKKGVAETLMEDVWKYVTPTERGIPTTEMLCESVKSYGAARKFSIKCSHCEVPEDKELRPSNCELTEFLEAALSFDIPVAFLNLCNGDEKNLDEWHWVTIVSLEQKEPDEHIMVRILDRGAIKAIDLTLWLATTNNGGGFVHFSKA